MKLLSDGDEEDFTEGLVKFDLANLWLQGDSWTVRISVLVPEGQVYVATLDRTKFVVFSRRKLVGEELMNIAHQWYEQDWIRKQREG